MRIQEVCRKTELSKRNIHYYIKENLITPSVNEENGYYDFSETDCRRLILVHEFRNAGLSISIIRSLLNTPAAAGYYLRLHAEKLKKEIRHLEQTADSLNYILDKLPLNPDFDALYHLGTTSAIPSPDTMQNTDGSEDADNRLVNHFLWRGFLPDDRLSEYQQFLWYKIHLMSTGTDNQDYRKIGHFLRSLDQEVVDRIYAQRYQHYRYIAELKESDHVHYANEMQARIRRFLESNVTVAFWKLHYEDFISPDIRICTSDISSVVEEMSPFFASYVHNINAVCAMTYRWLQSEDGDGLFQKMKKTLGDRMNLEDCNHGELESMSCLHLLTGEML